ncbi:hypothetical protein ACET3X_003337 [Alternaria dauci]|uniref:Uncharacterized protein n=1 Tax=Alternaria dauci TaxID=48095 RepID=A0ABR3USK7_9PLEO
MSTERLDLAAQVVQSLHTGVGSASHAHPSAGSLSSDDAGYQYFESLLANVAFDVELHGLALRSTASPSEMRCPLLRRSESKQQAINHLDVVSCWKGISDAQALELTLWERLFRRCLISQVENDLRRRTIVQLNNVRGGGEDEKALLSLLRALPGKQSRLIEVNLPNLIHDMIGAFYNDYSSQNAARNFRWSLGSGDLPGFVYNYITTRDCFLRSSEGLFVSAEMTLDYYTMPVVHAVVRLRWQPPNIKFRPIPAQLGRRGQYHIAPYREPDFSSHNRFPDTVVYTVTRSTSTVQWDSFSKLFRAQAPDTPTLSETLVQASMVTHFPDNVRFECVSRYAVKVQVVDTLQVNGMPDEYRPQTEVTSPPLTPPYVSESCPKKPASHKLQRHCDLEPSFLESSKKHLPDSPKKRKAVLHSTSDDGMPPAELVYEGSDPDLKRQKLELRSDIDMLAGIVKWHDQHSAMDECEAVLEAVETFRQNVESRTSSVERGPSEVVLRLQMAVAPALHLVYSAIKKELSDLSDLKLDNYCTPVKEKKEVPLSPGGQLATPPESPMKARTSFASASESSSNASILDTTNPAVEVKGAHDSCSSKLFQNEIQKNFREFEEAAKRRKTDPTTASSHDVGDMDFERIFLEDSEVEGVSGLSDDMDGLTVDEESD